jgi:hypothetical protein
MTNHTLLDKRFITTHLTAEDPWCFSHGSGNGSEDLGAGMLYYSLAYALRAKTCVCLGSGGGFVPRLMRQAQRDLDLEGGRTILVDGAAKVAAPKKSIWGSPCWTAEDSLFRTNYPEVEILLELTEDAYHNFFVPGNIAIDFLHIDADHHYEGVKLDWDLYSRLVPDSGVITLHDTMNYREPCGVHLLVDEIRRGGEYELINFPISYGTAILRRAGGRR